MGNNSIIEKSAVNSVETALLETGYVDTFINTGDKEPIWDGSVYLYQDNTHKDNEHLYGRISTQVKGTEAKIENSLKYNVSVSDLKHYLKDGGVLYFVVQVDLQHTANNKIFYCNLDPFHIKQYLSKKNKAKVQVDIKPLPQNPQEVIEILYNFYMHLQKQRAFCLLKDDVPQKEFGITNITIPYSSPFKDIDIEKVLLNLDSVSYINKDGIDYPFEEVKPGDISAIKTFNQDVSVNGKVYFHQYEILRSKYGMELIIGKFIKLKLKEGEKITYTYETKGTLSECIHNLTFFIESMKYNSIFLGDQSITLDFESKGIEALESKLRFLQKLQKALDLCHLEKELQLENLTDEDYRNIQILTQALIDHKDFGMQVPDDTLSFLFNVVVCKQRILCFARREVNGRYNLEAFSTDLPAMGEHNRKKYRISPYTILKHYNLVNVINLNFSNALVDIKKFGISEIYLGWVNNFVLQLLLAYDESKEVILLKTAKEVMNWVIEQSKDKKSEIPYKLNLLQCKYREGILFNEEDTDYLHHILESDSDSACKFGAYVLLKDPYAAKHFDKLDVKIQENIVKMPIYNLWKELNNG